jgi:hypothetical protein
MAAIVLTLVVSLILAGLLWLAVGPRFRFDSDPAQNDLLNLGGYLLLLLPFVFVTVFFLIERL